MLPHTATHVSIHQAFKQLWLPCLVRLRAVHGLKVAQVSCITGAVSYAATCIHTALSLFMLLLLSCLLPLVLPVAVLLVAVLPVASTAGVLQLLHPVVHSRMVGVCDGGMLRRNHRATEEGCVD